MGQVEMQMRAMRILGGGMPFAGDVTNPEIAREVIAQGERPVWFDNDVEREAVAHLEGLSPPSEETKKAIVRVALQGHYAEPQYAEANDTLATIKRYATKDPTYQAKDGRSLEAKVQSLLAGRKPPRPAQPKAS